MIINYNEISERNSLQQILFQDGSIIPIQEKSTHLKIITEQQSKPNFRKYYRENEIPRPSSAKRNALNNGAVNYHQEKVQDKRWLKKGQGAQVEEKKEQEFISSEDEDCNIEDEDLSHQVMDFSEIKASGRKERKCSQNLEQNSLSSKNEQTTSDIIAPIYAQSLQPVEETKDQNSGVSGDPTPIKKAKEVQSPQTSQSLKTSSKVELKKSQSKGSKVDSPLQNLMKTHIKKNSLLDVIYSPKKEKLILEEKREQRRAQMSQIIKKLDLQLKSVEADPNKDKDRIQSYSQRASQKKGVELKLKNGENSSQRSKLKAKNHKILSRNMQEGRESGTAPISLKMNGINCEEGKRSSRDSLSRPKSSRLPSTSIPYLIDLPKFSPRQTIQDLLDQEHEIISKFFEAKGLKTTGYCSPTKNEAGIKRKGTVSALPQSKTQISSNHLQQSDSYYQGLNSQLDNYMKAIAAMISEKNQIYQRNQELVVAIKEENVRVEQSYKDMQTLNRNIREEMETGAEIKKQIASVKTIVETVRQTHESRLKLEKGEMKCLKEKQKEVEKRIIESANEAENQALIYNTEEQKNYAQMKRLNMRSEETAKLIQGLKTNIQYQIALEKERAQMLAEKGRLLDQLICREKLSQHQLKKVKVSRDVTREVDKILTPRDKK